MPDRLRAVLVGAGQVGAGYAADRRMAAHVRYATHAQVLADHPAYEWVAAVDPSPEARDRLRDTWDVPVVAATIDEVVASEPEVAVLAVPPAARRDVLARLPALRGILVEKPLGASVEDATAFLDACRRRDVVVQVNLVRRADELLRTLAAGELVERIGPPQAITAIYGNGLRNNGTHVVDLVRMLAGEIDSVTACGPARPSAGPLADDVELAFGATLAGGATLSCQPVSFAHYREVGLDVWGTTGRLAIYLEGLVVQQFRRAPNRGMEGEWEVASDEPELLPSTIGSAFFRMYTNLAEVIGGRAEGWSDGASALRSTSVVEAAIESARRAATIPLP